MPELVGKTALITGGTTGLGRAMAERFLDEGASVVITGRDARLGAEAETALARGAIRFLRADAGEPDQARASVDETVRLFGGLDILVNNAGIGVQAGLLDTPLDAYDRVMDVNVRGAFVYAQAAFPHLETRGGVMLHVASDAGVLGEEDIGIYSVSKAALIMLSNMLAIEGGRRRRPLQRDLPGRYRAGHAPHGPARPGPPRGRPGDLDRAAARPGGRGLRRRRRGGVPVLGPRALRERCCPARRRRDARRDAHRAGPRTVDSIRMVTIAHISDPHLGSPYFVPNLMNRVIVELNELAPDAVVVSGDLTTEGFRPEYKAWLAYAERIEAPLLTVPGNHDSRNVGYVHFEDLIGPRMWSTTSAACGSSASTRASPISTRAQVGRVHYPWITQEFAGRRGR